MLAADKLLLQSNLKQRAIQLREKELNLFNENFNAVGTQAAVLAKVIGKLVGHRRERGARGS